MNSAVRCRGERTLICLFLLVFASFRGRAQGIPEPDLIMYGRVLNITDNANLRLGYGTLTCTFVPSGGGNPISASTVLTNINNQFSYILHIPCETPVNGFPTSTNTIELTAAGVTFNRSQVVWNSNLVAFAQPSLTNTTFFSNDRGRIERVDLTVSTPIIIDPLNGLPVDWELSYFGHTGVDPLADPDHDGMNNYAEYLAGTDPNDPASGFRFTQILPVTGGMQLKWLSADFKAYALQRSSAPSSGFVDIRTGIPGTAPTNAYVDTTAPAQGTFFYRLRIDTGSSVGLLTLASIQKDPLGGIRLSWLSVPSQTYVLQRCTNLTSGFVDLSTNINATPPLNSYRDASAVGFGPYFYRLRLGP